MDRPEHRNARAARSAVGRIGLRSRQLKDEPRQHHGDSDRNPARPQFNQYAPDSYPRRRHSPQRPRATPDAGARTPADYGKNSATKFHTPRKNPPFEGDRVAACDEPVSSAWEGGS